MLKLLRELRLSQAPRRLWLVLALTATTPFWDLGHPLMEVDDARYAEVPREMALGGDWATPHLNELDYVEKPPLCYWMSAASYKIFGVNEAAARLPLALLALLGLLGTAWLGSWLYDARTGWHSALILGTSGLFFALAHFITPDMGLAVWLLWCTALLLRALLRPEDAAWAGPGAWLCAGLAFLSKGLVGLVFPAVWTMALAVLLPELRPRLRPLLRPLGPALFLLVVAPWFALMEQRHPGFLHFFFLEHHLQRFATLKYNRASPWYFFLLVLPAGLLPWTPAVAAGLGQAVARRREDGGRGLALAAWAALITAFFSCSSSKLFTYILPVFPQLAILAARALDDIAAGVQRAARTLGLILIAAAVAAVPATRLVSSAHLPSPWLAPLAAVALGALGLALLRPKSLLAGACAGLVLGAAGLTALRAAASELSCRDLARAISRRAQPGDLVYTYGTYLHGLPFYAGRRVERTINWWGELEYGYRDSDVSERRAGGHDYIEFLPLPGKRVFVACCKKDAPFVLSLSLPESIRSARPHGRWILIEY